MGKTSNASKQRWNVAHYTQVKVSLPTETAAAFKARCETDGVSMASEITRFMDGCCCNENFRQKKAQYDVETRQKRRKALRLLIQQIEKLKDAEEDYKERMPENLRNSCRHEAAEQAVEALEDALDLLNEAY